MSNRWLHETANSYYTEIEGTLCAYCGNPGETQEHLYPISAMYKLIELGEKEIYSFIFPACLECNCLAGALVFQSFNDKREYIRNSLKSKYNSILDIDYKLDDFLYESDKIILHKVHQLRNKNLLERRLSFQHNYNFSNKDGNENIDLDSERFIYKDKAGKIFIYIEYRSEQIYLQYAKSIPEAKALRNDFLNSNKTYKTRFLT